jgi:hypothetical protein
MEKAQVLGIIQQCSELVGLLIARLRRRRDAYFALCDGFL